MSHKKAEFQAEIRFREALVSHRVTHREIPDRTSPDLVEIMKIR